MLYPRRTQESADARAALMAKLPPRFMLDIDDLSRTRTRHLQAERVGRYRTPPLSPRKSPASRCRRTPPLVLSALGWGAFLKDETLRFPDGKVVRDAQDLCANHTPLVPIPFIVSRRLSKACLTALELNTGKDASTNDCPMASPLEPTLSRTQRPSLKSGEDDCEMPACDELAHRAHDMEMDVPAWSQVSPLSGGSGDQLYVQAADDLFAMFIDETCMESD